MAFLLPCQGNFGIANERPRKGIAYVWPKVQGLKQSLVWAEKESNWWYRRPDGQSAICYQTRCHHNFVWVCNNKEIHCHVCLFEALPEMVHDRRHSTLGPESEILQLSCLGSAGPVRHNFVPVFLCTGFSRMFKQWDLPADSPGKHYEYIGVLGILEVLLYYMYMYVMTCRIYWARIITTNEHHDMRSYTVGF